MAFVNYDKMLNRDEVSILTGIPTDELRQLEWENKLPKRISTSKGRKWRKLDIELWNATGRPDCAAFEASETVKRIDHLRQEIGNAAEIAAELRSSFRRAADEALKSAKEGMLPFPPSENG